MSLRLTILLALLALSAPLLPAQLVAAQQPGDASVQAFLDAQPGPLKSFQDNGDTAAMVIESRADYYGLSPRLYLALLEASAGLLSNPAPTADALKQPFGAGGPDGFTAQIEWASRELRAGLGPYDAPPTLLFSDGTTVTLTLQQAPEGVAVQRFLAARRSQPEWRAVVERFNQAFARYFNNQLPSTSQATTAAPPAGFLGLPWPDGVRVRHLAYFDHMYPTVDSGDDGNSTMLDYLGRGDVQYDSHDGHDFVFLDEPIGTPILAAAPGIAYARTARGNGVVIRHAGGYETVYWHLDRFASMFDGKVNSGNGVSVNAGDVIGSSGRSGFVQGTPHLHFEVRLAGREVDPYGWFGQGPDPCSAYAGCLASSWLWQSSLRGKYDFTPPSAAPAPDTTPPVATLTVQPRAGLRFLARFDGHAVQQVGQGFAAVEGLLDYRPAHAGTGVLVSPEAGLSYPTAGNVPTATGTIAFWASLPGSYPASTTGHSYLLAASANPTDDAGIFAGTLALRHDLEGGAPGWTFWTVGDGGEGDKLRAPDTLSAGLHHFALTWDRARGSKTLYIDGAQVAQREGAVLPTAIGARLELGRFTEGAGHSNAVLDELAIFDQALGPQAIAALARNTGEVAASAPSVQSRDLLIDVNASDAGGIDKVQLGLDGHWEAPRPYYDTYLWHVQMISGTLLLGARFFDRAGNVTTITSSVELAMRTTYLPLLQQSRDPAPPAPAAEARPAAAPNASRRVFLPFVGKTGS